MDVTVIIGLLTALEHARVAVAPARCVHSMARSSACDACRDVCPSGAVEGDGPPSFDEAKCTQCGACVVACPTGAFGMGEASTPIRGMDALDDRRLELDVACSSHPHADLGPRADGVGCRVDGCLARLGAGSYLSLVALGAQSVRIRLDACGTCPQGRLTEPIRQQADRARRLLSLWRTDATVEVADAAERLVPRPLRLSAPRERTMSRRDLLRTVCLRPREPARRPEDPADSRQGRNTGEDRARLLGAVDRFAEPPARPSASLEGLGFAMLAVSEACTACLACARACPTGALRSSWEAGDGACRLTFLPRTCIGCGVCAAVCAMSAIAIDHSPRAGEVFGSRKAVVLWHGEMSRCERCRNPFPTRFGTDLCPACDFRSRHPFGTALPGGGAAARIRA